MVPGKIHYVGSTQGNRTGCLNGVFSLLTLCGVLVAHLFKMDGAAFSQSALHRTPLLNQVRKVSLEREESISK